nr:MAG TPA: hypothetical protein [Bacteriophage sp.]
MLLNISSHFVHVIKFCDFQQKSEVILYVL